MSDTTVTETAEDAPAKKSSKIPLIIGLVLALAGGGGGFFAVQSGLLFGSGTGDAAQGSESAQPVEPLPDISFVELPQLRVSLGPRADDTHLIFRASLEVPSGQVADVEAIKPRIVDVLNSYLRALEPADVEAQGALVSLRAQMLRRIQLVTGDGRVNDLLVMEFVLN